MIQDTAGQIVNYAAVECGLSAVSDVFTSGDPIFVQLRTLLTSCGRELVKARNWKILTKTGVLTTSATGVLTYPADYDRAIDQTLGDTGSDGRESRVLTNWEYGRAQRQSATPFSGTNDYTAPSDKSVFEQAGDTAEVLPSVATGSEYALLYITKNWVQDGAAPTTFKTAPTNHSDVVLFESLLVVKLLKLRFLESKGFDTTAAATQFAAAMSAVSSGERSAPVLDLALPMYQGERLIDEYNLPYRV